MNSHILKDGGPGYDVSKFDGGPSWNLEGGDRPTPIKVIDNGPGWVSFKVEDGPGWSTEYHGEEKCQLLH